MATKELVAEETLDMGMYNKALMEEPLSGFDLYLKKEVGLDKEQYWQLPVPLQILHEDNYAVYKKAQKGKASVCCGD